VTFRRDSNIFVGDRS